MTNLIPLSSVAIRMTFASVFVFLVCWSTPLLAAEPSRIDRVLELIGNQDLAAAQVLLLETPSDAVVKPRQIAVAVKLSRSLERSGELSSAAEVMHRTAQWSAVETPASIPIEKRIAISNAAADLLTRDGRYADAMGWLTWTLTQPDSSERTAAANQLLSVAAGYLDQHQCGKAADAYRIATEHLSDASLATARLGLAWSLTVDGKDLIAAEAAIENFLKSHPEHVDVPAALLLQLSCRSKRHDSDGVKATRDRLVRDFSDTDAAMTAVLSACSDTAFIDRDQSIQEFLVRNVDLVIDRTSLTGDCGILAAGLLQAIKRRDAEPESRYADAIAKRDMTGQAASSVLQTLTSSAASGDAERIAVHWISPPASADTDSGPVITVAVREAACRWAGRTGRWSMLAMAADEEQIDPSMDVDAKHLRGRNVHVDRLLAESLLQSGRPTESLRWWTRIVEDWKADDFPTLLRLAETTVAAGNIDDAVDAIAAARNAAGQESVPSGRVLVDLLDADVQIRKLQFDAGRATLERIVRSSAADADLRGRSQWMIGETYFMQERFAEAIDAYRRVEGIGGQTQWAAAALVQAGASFEKLGRTREATVCYSTLLSRFADSPHTPGARVRLAALSSDSQSPSKPSSNAPMRR